MWPGVPVLPIMSTGATDALYLRNAGIPVYGVSGHFFEGQEFLYRLVKALTSGRVS